MEEDKKYIISLDDNIDISYLQLEMLLNENNADTVPIWSIGNKKSDEFYEFELVAEEENATISVCEENSSTEQCYICDTSVPTAFAKNHYASEKHRTCVAIILNSLQRATQNAQSVPFTHTGSTTKSVSHASASEVYFCDNCSLAVKLKNKETHENTKEHQVSVIHDRLLNGLLITYLDKSKVADSRYEAKTPDTSDDCTKENDVNDSNVAVKHINGADITYDEKDKQSKTEEDNDDKLIISKDEHQDDVAIATYLMLCDESCNSVSSESIINQVNDNHGNAVASNEQHSVEIVTVEGLTFYVLENNYHGFVNTWGAWAEDGNFDCLLCEQVLVDIEAHKQDSRHIELINKPIRGSNCIRQINDVWYHCIICNQKLQNQKLHVLLQSHRKKIKPLLVTRKQLKLQKRAENMYYCDKCNCEMSITNKDQHMIGVRHVSLLRANRTNTAKNRVLHYHLKKFEGETLCIVCNIVVYDDDIDTHVKSNAHDLSYKKFLVANKITKLKTGFKCYACNSRQKNMFEIDHAQSEIHKNNLSVYKPIPSLPLNENSIKDIGFSDEDAPLLYLFESTDKLYNIKCRVCKKDIKLKPARIKKHIKKQYHQFNLQALLLVNKIKNRCDGTYFCELCRFVGDFYKEIDHINSGNHERNMRNVSLSWRQQRDDNISTAAVSSTDNPTSKVNVFDNNIVEKPSKKLIEIGMEPSTSKPKECSKPRESYQFKQLLQMNKLRSVEDGELFFCDLCAEHVTIKHVFDHVQFESHFEKLTENLNEKDKNLSHIYCDACQTHIPDIYYIKDIHNRSKQHLLNSKKLGTKKQANTEECDINAASSNVAYMFEPADKQFSIKCKVCQHILATTKSNTIKRHMESSKHITSLILLRTKNKFKLQFTGNYLCEFCNDNVEVEEMLNHIDSEKHINNIVASKGTDSKNNHATNSANSNTEKEIITGGNNKKKLVEMFQTNINQPANETKPASCAGNNISVHSVNTQTLSINNKATEKYAAKSLSNKIVKYDSVKLLNHKINDSFDNNGVRLHSNSVTKNADVKKLCNKDINNYLVEVPSKPTEVMCKICKTVIPKTESNMQDHLKGKRHNLNYNKFVSETAQCEVIKKQKTLCDINATKTNAAEHAKSDTNKNAVFLQDPIFKFVEGILFCRCCKTEVPSTQHNIKTHLTGWRHEVKLSAMLAENGFEVSKNKVYCNICDMYFSNLKGITHIDSPSHKMKASAKTVENIAQIN